MGLPHPAHSAPIEQCPKRLGRAPKLGATEMCRILTLLTTHTDGTAMTARRGACRPPAASMPRGVNVTSNDCRIEPTAACAMQRSPQEHAWTVQKPPPRRVVHRRVETRRRDDRRARSQPSRGALDRAGRLVHSTTHSAAPRRSALARFHAASPTRAAPYRDSTSQLDLRPATWLWLCMPQFDARRR